MHGTPSAADQHVLAVKASAPLFQFYRLGNADLGNRVVMAPMTRSRATHNGEANLVAFGVPFIANPDLPRRYQMRAPLNVADQATFYAGEDKGFVDYPALA
jgi:2,4-dienoyl-CoA reductase-like NADH-dependent reductase (Old Yellow Enzyme family)